MGIQINKMYPVESCTYISPYGKEVNLRNRNLTELPVNLKGATHIESLDLSGNKIEALPIWLNELVGLKSLSVSGNLLKAFPDLPPNLEKLYLSQNALTNLPSLAQTQLVDIVIDKNQIKSLPENPFPKSVEYINLNHNQIPQLPTAIRDCTQLRALLMDHNRLTKLPEELEELPLSKIEAEGNLIDEFPSFTSNMPDLLVLDLKGNPCLEGPITG